MRKFGFLMCAVALGCGNTQGAGSPTGNVDDDSPNGDIVDDSGDGGAGGSADGGPGGSAGEAGGGGTDGSGPKGGPDPQTGVYLFDCDTIAGGIEDLPIKVTVNPFEHFSEGRANSVTLSGSITLDQPTVAGIASRGVDVVDIDESRITVRISGATPAEVDLPGPTIVGFDFLLDTDNDGEPGPHTFEVGPVVADITATGGSAVGFSVDIDSMQLSIDGVPIVGSLDIPDFCSSRALDGEPIIFALSDGEGTGGEGGTDGAGGGGGDDDMSPCDRDRPLDDGVIFDGSLRERLCEWRDSRGQ